MSKKNKKKKKGIAFFSRAKSATPEPMVAEEVTAAEMPAAGDSGVTVVPAGAFDYSKANEGQREAIEATDGPVLIIAGPGTGKTYTLVQRALNLIVNKGVKPEEIMMATFTEKAAKELVTRISNELTSLNIPVNLTEMYIGTFHSICLRIIKENLEYTRIKKNFRTLDDFDQKYMVFQNIRMFQRIPRFSDVITSRFAWEQAKEICSYVNNLTEELVDADKLAASRNADYEVIGQILLVYQQLVTDNNYLDFSGIQTEAYWLLSNHPEILASVQDKIKYLMIDEYQDTNYIQEQIAFAIAGRVQNICVVGDDDQGLYRFRGATIRNILEFPDNFTDKECKVVKLTVNYRSNSDIVDFYNLWMQSTDCGRNSFAWDRYRYDKRIVPHKQSALSSPAVIRVATDEGEDAWHEENLAFIRMLLDSGKINDLNQIAFLFNSVKNDKVIRLARYLEDNGINVYSPRSDMFFERQEIKMMIGCLLLCFSEFGYKIQDRDFKYVDESLCQYYESCMQLVGDYLETPEGEALADTLGEMADYHSFMEKNTEYAFSGIAYRLLRFEPFASILETDMHSGVVDLRPARNLALLTSILTKYEYLHGVDVFTPEKIEKNVELFFNMFLKLLMRGGIAEYEDEAEYAPSGCVSFLTIHQSKGMEFPVVVVGSLSNAPRARSNDIINGISQEYFMRPPFEPYDTIKFFDFWRLYYTAFSRAQNLLVLTANMTNREPSMYFRELFKQLPDYTSDQFDVHEFDFAEVKDVNLKETYSFTSNIAVYEECALQYKFFKELGFAETRVGATIFGTIVHETIEDVHRAVLRGEEHLVTADNLRSWLEMNYSTASKAEHAYLGRPQIEAALRQVEKYVERHKDDWSRIREAEVDVSLVKPDYILSGKIDLIRGEDGTVEIVDFKSEKRPDTDAESVYFDRYRRQLQVYAHLVEAKTGQQVSKMSLYYTGETEGVPMVTFPYVQADIATTISEFDAIVHRIQRKDFSSRSTNQKTCNNCDFRFYCKKGGE